MKLVVIGGGPAGLTAALQARELHATVTLLESKRIDGTSINEGPAPVRTLARAARLVRDVGSWETFGLRGERPQIDLDEGLKLHYRKQEQLGSLDVGAVFFAAGWPGNIDSLNLDAAGVLTKGSYIPVNDYLQSNVLHIFRDSVS